MAILSLMAALSGGLFLAPEDGSSGGSPPAITPPVPPPPQVPATQAAPPQDEWKSKYDALMRAQKEKEEAALSNEQRLQRQISEMQEFQRTQFEAYNARQAALEESARQERVRAYRAELLRGYGDRIPVQFQGMVQGSNEAEIYNSALQAAQYAAEYRASIEREMATRFQQALVPQAPPPGATPAVPPNPHYTAPNVGFPTAPNSPSPVPTNPLEGIGQLTSEQAVRNGTYAAKREALMSQLKGGGVPTTPNLVQPPVYPQPGYQQIPQVQLPNGVTQPAPAPMRPVMPPPQAMPPVASAAQAQMDAAQAAINAVRGGTSPVLSDPVNSAVRAGPIPQGNATQAMQARFAPTPPINNQGST